MCPSGAACLSANCCFSDLALCKSNSACWSRTKQTSSSFHWHLACSRHDIAEQLLSWWLFFVVNRDFTLRWTHSVFAFCNWIWPLFDDVTVVCLLSTPFDLKLSLHTNLPRVSEWLLFNPNSAIVQLYHGENRLNVNGMMMRNAKTLWVHLNVKSRFTTKNNQADVNLAFNVWVFYESVNK
jgi:hypothetical protein